MTVVTVVRNDVSGIEGTILSVAGQTHRPLEYIIVDGASTDGTLDVIKRHENSITSWSSEPDRGIADGLNKGVSLATGDLIIFMNSGDSFVDQRTLARAVALIPADVRPRECIFYGDAIYKDGSKVTALHTDHRALPSGSALCHPSVLVGADVQKQNLYDDRLAIFMDYDLWLRCLGKYRFIKLPIAMSNFMAGGVSGADVSGVRFQLEQAVVQLINEQMPMNIRSLLEVIQRTVFFLAKRKLRRIIGPRRYLVLKRLVGRNSPSSWAPPSAAAEPPVDCSGE